MHSTVSNVSLTFGEVGAFERCTMWKTNYRQVSHSRIFDWKGMSYYLFRLLRADYFQSPSTQPTWGTPLLLYGFCPALCTRPPAVVQHLPPSFRLIYSQRGYKSRENCRSFRNTPFPPLPPLLRTPQRENESVL